MPVSLCKMIRLSMHLILSARMLQSYLNVHSMFSVRHTADELHNSWCIISRAKYLLALQLILILQVTQHGHLLTANDYHAFVIGEG